MYVAIGQHFSRLSLCIVGVLLLVGASGDSQAADIEVLALFRDQAVIRIDGQRYNSNPASPLPKAYVW